MKKCKPHEHNFRDMNFLSIDGPGHSEHCNKCGINISHAYYELCLQVKSKLIKHNNKTAKYPLED